VPCQLCVRSTLKCRTNTPGSSFKISTVTVPPFCIASRAFSKRFKRTCVSSDADPFISGREKTGRWDSILIDAPSSDDLPCTLVRARSIARAITSDYEPIRSRSSRNSSPIREHDDSKRGLSAGQTVTVRKSQSRHPVLADDHVIDPPRVKYQVGYESVDLQGHCRAT
jgi:hypothetical protein